MIRYALNDIARITGGQLLPGSQGKDEIHGVATDSRHPMLGKLFVALAGEHFDGADFVPAALAQGASAVLCQRTVEAPGILVQDTLVAFQKLAAQWRQRFSIPFVAITGSCGKTTVKEVLTAILNEHGPVLSTHGNQNNHLGVPLTLARLGAEHRYAVLEMGMNHAGELTVLSGLAKPTLALINNAGPAHLAGLGSVAAVAAAKGEILSGLDAQGIAILNGDDTYADFWAEKAPGEIWRFSLEQRPARVQGQWQAGSGLYQQLEVRAPQGEFTLEVPLPGKHNGANVLAAVTAALALDVDIAQIQRAVAGLQAVPGRLQWRPGLAGSRLLDDTYNANPASLEAALRVLAAQSGQRILVLGDMGELGPDAALYHRQAGLLARQLGIDALYGLGPLAAEAATAFGADAEHFLDMDPLLARLQPRLNPETVVLIKGSRAAHMERVVQALMAGVA
ncbi:UDP-N-acetylmuramoyl-tripeptide--D-alanyl-D-alanine ligase [Acidithiobacillus marinus]|uniref:UDP-N-acetylmuramoyl-tripeptide--D-alanyl-D-alanine ligase n=1 Tax=Acidithiobacillus marinus TaxID=187490 RepID=A0A2I1DPZ9_9PROT|nr:UDP-N-acetylmuramoyl-tripeptide--D-alanyl-D-alanine ligase [Acidithiobacillus marinus]PKY11927.1 UDP-N-acetylmuramoyl-tripeptide--D-alanyl-D-alanine ligase [Acidithiobacillus marinus]